MLIDIGSALPTTISRLNRLPVEHHLVLYTFKKDRSITILKLSHNTFQVTEHGFQEKVLTVETAKLRKVLKNLLKREFPRSNKVRLLCGLRD